MSGRSDRGRAADRIIAGKAKPQYFLPGTVWDAALERVRWVFEEFDGNVTVSSSGGKDSTVTMELALIVARERGELPLRVHFLDQEAEYQATIDYLRRVKARTDEIAMDWYQIPFRLFNASSFEHQWSHVWDPALDDDTWIRAKEPDSIKENDFFDRRGRQIDRFKEVLHAMNVRDGGAILTGMRCEESPTRRVFMTSVASYKWATWCSGPKAAEARRAAKEGTKPGPYLFHPVYDWSYRDVWKAIYDHEWDYNTFYDVMFQYGIPTRSMRVSSFHHEVSQGALDYLHEMEPETWERAVKRLPGLNTYKSVGESIAAEYVTKYPYMFTSWADYTIYLAEHLITTDESREMIYRKWRSVQRQLSVLPRSVIAQEVAYAVMFNDVYCSNLSTWAASQKNPGVLRNWKRWKADPENKYDPDNDPGAEMIEELSARYAYDHQTAGEHGIDPSAQDRHTPEERTA